MPRAVSLSGAPSKLVIKDITFVLLEEKDSVEGDVFWPAKNVERKSEYYATMVEMKTKIEEVHASDDCVAEFFNLKSIWRGTT